MVHHMAKGLTRLGPKDAKTRQLSKDDEKSCWRIVDGGGQGIAGLVCSGVVEGLFTCQIMDDGGGQGTAVRGPGVV